MIPPPSLGHAGERLHEWMFATRWWREMVGEPRGQPRRRRHVVPIVLGRGVRLWDGLEGLERDYAIEAVSSPAGVTHLSFTRREGPGAG